MGRKHVKDPKPHIFPPESDVFLPLRSLQLHSSPALGVAVDHGEGWSFLAFFSAVSMALSEGSFSLPQILDLPVFTLTPSEMSLINVHVLQILLN